ncbi:hypothetical protein N566_16940 [Streptomycetaceae bacterium MP113-05]|nr:hypothetical protein N566_16940 [Streptomycetaceae bacterium MP113-05]
MTGNAAAGPLDTARSTVMRLPRHFPAEQARRPAFVGTGALTYGEFTERVDAASCRLLDLEVQVGDRAVIWMDKQPRYAEAIFAAMQAGCAYVPLDGRQPAARVRAVLADAEPAVLFTDADHLRALGEEALPGSLKMIVVSGGQEAGTVAGIPVRSWDAFTGYARGRVTILPRLKDTDLAAILYTSGSTGTPKGVTISHRNLVNFVRWAREELDVGPVDVFANHASFNFDLSTFDLFVALTAGAAVWIVGDAQARDVSALAEGMREHSVTVWYSVPSVLNLLTASGALTPEAAGSLRYVLFAGEVFPIPQLRALTEQLPGDTVLYNFYGPTETNVCTYHRIRPGDLERDTPVPVGRAIDGARLEVVDDRGRTVTGADTIGELVVHGDCVTPGYWRLQTDPAAAHHRRGSHPTGDLVSYEQDGLLVYRGRKDRMVKLSGYRVELGEIEAAALRHPALAETAVIVTGEGERARLTLYFSVHEGARKPGLLEIKRHCARHLPVYMVPHAVKCLDRLPLNPNGKADYRRLSAARSSPALIAVAP